MQVYPLHQLNDPPRPLLNPYNVHLKLIEVPHHLPLQQHGRLITHIDPKINHLVTMIVNRDTLLNRRLAQDIQRMVVILMRRKGGMVRGDIRGVALPFATLYTFCS